MCSVKYIALFIFYCQTHVDCSCQEQQEKRHTDTANPFACPYVLSSTSDVYFVGNIFSLTLYKL